MATRVNSEMIVQINELYKEIGTYAGVSRELGIAPSTVKKYVDPNYIPKADLVLVHVDIADVRAQVEKFTFDFSDFDSSTVLMLSEEEEEEIHELWKELSV